MLEKAPLVIAVLGRAAGHPWWIEDCSAATENILLEAAALGLGAVWCGMREDPDDVVGYERACCEALGAPPDEWRAVALIAVGHPARDEAAAHTAPGEQGQLRALRQARALTRRPGPWQSTHARGTHPGHRAADPRGHPRGQALAALARAAAGRDDGVGDGRRTAQGRDAALRRRLPHAAQPSRDRPPPARVLHPRGRSPSPRRCAGASASPARARRWRRWRAPSSGGRCRGSRSASSWAGMRADAVPALKALRDAGTGFTLDVLGEATVSEAEARGVPARLPRPPRRAGRRGRRWPAVAVLDDAAWGPLPRVNLSLKITSLYSQIDPVDFDGQRRGGQGPPAPHLPQGDRDRRRPHPRPRAVPLPRPHPRGVHLAAGRRGVPRLRRRRRRAPGLPARRRPRPRAAARLGARPRAPASTCASSRARTGTTRPSSRRRRAGRCRCSRTSRTPTPCTRSSRG